MLLILKCNMMNRIYLPILVLLAVGLLAHMSGVTSFAFADKCNHKNDAKCRDGSDSKAIEKLCATKNSKDENNDSENPNVNMLKSNGQTMGNKCSEVGSSTNSAMLGEGPYSFPTDLFSLPTWLSGSVN